MLDRWQDLKTWLGSLRPGCPERWPTDPSLEVELKECGQTGFELVDCSEDQGDGRGWIGDEVQRQIARSVVNRLEKKVGGSKLVTQPSILLIHAKLPLTPRLGSARDIILEGGNQELVSKIRDRFQQVWLMTEDEVTEI